MSLDFTGDFAFAGAFDFIKNGKDATGFHNYGVDAMTKIETLGTMPWLRSVVLASPTLANNAFYTMALNTARTRQMNGSKTRDLLYYLVSL
jgi:hypothetical protein